MMPTKNIVNALVNNGIKIYLCMEIRQEERVLDFDYTESYSEVLPWFVDENNICRKDNDGRLLEIPIYCVNKNIASFLTPVRLYK
jgi:hypothetical protein